MIRLVLAFLLLSPTAMTLASDKPEDTLPSSMSAHLQQLPGASLREKAEILSTLVEIGGRTAAPVLAAMTDGDLYHDDDSGKFYRVYRDDQGREVGEVLLGDGEVVDTETLSLDNIRVNNRLRIQIRDARARINLMHGSVAERRAAAREMLDNINNGSIELLKEALEGEEDAAVVKLLETGIAMFSVANEDEPSARVSAIEQLGGRLENPVRNLLTSYAPGGFMDEQNPQVLLAAEQALEKSESRIRFFRFTEQLFYGLSLGSVLLLAAIGLAVTFGVMGVINMAHGEMLMLGAYTTYVIQQLMPDRVGLSILLSIPAAFLVAGVAGLIIQRFVIRYLEGRPLETLLATFGISLILQQAVRSIFSPLNRMVSSPEWLSGSLQINPVLSITYSRLYILFFSLAVFGLLLLIMKKTSLGLQVRAVAQNRPMARAMGIRTGWVDAMTFGLGTGIAGIAGVALTQLTNVGPSLGQSYIIDSFMVVVFGGVGNLLGTLVGAFTIGIGNNFLEPLTGSVLAKIFILVFIILFIQKRPKGLFPQKGRAAE